MFPQNLIIGFAFFADAPATPALPATKALLPIATIGAISSKKAECFRVFLCTMYSSHRYRPTGPALNKFRHGASPPHRGSGEG